MLHTRHHRTTRGRAAELITLSDPVRHAAKGPPFHYWSLATYIGGPVSSNIRNYGERERIVIEAIVGAAVGALTIVSARITRGQRWLYSLGLLTLPSLYAFFALQACEQAVGVKEMIDGIPCVVAGLVFAFVSVRQSAVVGGAFWIHPLVQHLVRVLSREEAFIGVGVESAA